MKFSPDQVSAFQKLETPFYFYDMNLLDKTIAALKTEAGRYGYHIHYAVKANVNERILKKIAIAGLGADCVSGNEILKSLETGFSADKLVFAGVGKTDKEILIGLENDIFCFNCESIQELEILNELAAKLGKKTRVAFRLNPDLDAKTHHHITTGLEENKFGIPMDKIDIALEVLTKCKQLMLIGLHFHIGSQVTDLVVFQRLSDRVNALQMHFQEQGFPLSHLNLGGGLGINYYEPHRYPIADFAQYFGIVNQYLKPLPGQQIHFELGRSIIAQSGSLVSRVLYVKHAIKNSFVVIDAGITELIRPALYSAHHHIENLSSKKALQKYHVVGPICESSDCFGKNIPLPETNRGDLIAIRSAGAYGQVLTSMYNLRTPVPTIYSDEL